MLTAPPSNADQAIAMLLADPLFAPLIAAHRELDPRPPRHAPWPKGVDGRIVTALRGRGVEALYTHQAAAYDAASARRNVVVVTPTASGKTLCYNLPVLDAVAEGPRRRGRSTSSRRRRWRRTRCGAARADRGGRHRPEDVHVRRRHAGERSPRGARRRARRRHEPRHAAHRHPPAPHEVDEALREPAVTSSSTSCTRTAGVFGSHVANVIRRLRRICRFYGSDPIFICAQRTIANPRELAERILEAPVELIDDNGAPAGRKHILVVQPAGRQRELGIRSSAL